MEKRLYLVSRVVHQFRLELEGKKKGKEGRRPHGMKARVRQFFGKYFLNTIIFERRKYLYAFSFTAKYENTDITLLLITLK